MTDTLLKVDNSLMQARWVVPTVALDAVEQIARQHDLPEIIARLIQARNIPADKIESFLEPKYRGIFPIRFHCKERRHWPTIWRKRLWTAKKLLCSGISMSMVRHQRQSSCVSCVIAVLMRGFIFPTA